MSTHPDARAWIHVRADALRRNFARVRSDVGPDVGILPMVKADAYGLGVDRVVASLQIEGPWGWGVATLSEGLHLRTLGIDAPVLVMSPLTPPELEDAVEAGLQLSVSSLETLELLQDAARRVGRPAAIHVDVDTGMGRTGFDWRSVEVWLPRVLGAVGAHVTWTGCQTHLHSADEDSASVPEQVARFGEVLGRIPDSVGDVVVHAFNSAGIFRAPSPGRSVVRPGIFLYGGAIGERQPVPEPVVSVHARVVHVREAAPGTTLGYGATYTASRGERWATLAIGYGDGLPRVLGNRGSVLVGGARASIIGRISMDLTVVDITDVPGVRVGDVATIVGRDGRHEITVDEVAELAGTISYEILTGFTPRLPRSWTDLDG